MKIAFLLDTFPSLTETFIARDIEALRRHGLGIEVFALRCGEGAQPLAPSKSAALLARGALEKLTSPGVRAGYFKDLGAAWWQQLQARGTAPDIQHIHAGWASHPAYIAWGAAEKAGLTWSFSGHARDIFVEGGDLQRKMAAAQFAAVCTKAAARHLENIAPERKSKIIYAPHGIEAQRIEFGSLERARCAADSLRGAFSGEKRFRRVVGCLRDFASTRICFHGAHHRRRAAV